MTSSQFVNGRFSQEKSQQQPQIIQYEEGNFLIKSLSQPWNIKNVDGKFQSHWQPTKQAISKHKSRRSGVITIQTILFFSLTLALAC